MTALVVVQDAIDKGMKGHDKGRLSRDVIIYLAINALAWVLQTTLVSGLAGVGQNVVLGLRRDLFNHLTTLSLRYFSQQKAGWIIARLTSDVDALSDVLSQGLTTLVVNTLTLLAAIVGLFVLDWRLGLVALVILPPTLVLTRWFQVRSHAAFLRVRETISSMTAQIAESVSGMAVIQAFNRERAFLSEFDAANDANRRTNTHAQYLNSLFFPGIEMLGAIAMASVLWVGGRMLTHGTLTIGTLVSSVFLLNLVFQPLQELSDLYGQVQSAGAAMEKITTVLDVEAEIHDEPGSIAGAAHRRRPAPRPRHVRVRQGAGAARDRHPRPGRRLPGARRRVGRRQVDDREARRPLLRSGRGCHPRRRPRPAGAGAALVPAAARRRAPGSVPLRRHDRRQHPLRAPGGHRRRGRRRRALRRDRPHRAPLHRGLLHEVREGGSGLSAGERQLISIARALLADPRILILDEATSNIDRPTEILIERALDRLLRGRTSIIIAHRLATVRRADEILVMEHGRITQRGRFDDLLAEDGPFRRLASQLQGASEVLQAAPVTGSRAEQLRERRELRARVAADEQLVDAAEMRDTGGAQLVGASRRQLRVRDPRVRLAGLLADEPGPLESLEQPGDSRRGQQDPLGEVDPPQHAVLGVREMQQHLVVVQRQPVLALELGGQLARDRSVRAQERDPGIELLWRRVGGCHRCRETPCALKCSGNHRTPGAPDRFFYMSWRSKGIEVEGLVRQFKDVRAVDGIDLRISPGEIYGFLGPNGAGKSTTVHMLTTLLPPTAGRATVAGYDIVREGPKVRAVDRRRAPGDGPRPVPDGPRAPPPAGSLHGIRGAKRQELIDRLLTRVGLTSAGDRKIRTYSGGMKRRLDLALSLIHSPSILFLDEPTTGLDPQSRTALWEEVGRLARDEGVTVFLTTQYLEEADVLADRVGIIDHGRIVAEGTPAALKAEIGKPTVEVVPEDAGEGQRLASILDRFGAETAARPGASAVQLDGHGALADVIRALDQENLRAAEINLHQPSLDDVFLAKTGHTLEGSDDE